MIARARSCLVAAVIIVSALAPYMVRADIIDNFETSVHVRTDGSAEVMETILYDFGAAEHHGIYRDIPVVYADGSGAQHEITIDHFKVLDGKLSPIPFESFKNGDDIRLKIGDPNVLVTGKKKYDISYTAHGVVGFFADHDELYWNATGNQWQFQILESSARVYAPASTTQASCYVGPAGSTQACKSKQIIAKDGTAWLFVTGHELSAFEGLTVAVGFPKGIVAQPISESLTVRRIKEFGSFAIPFFVLIFLTYRWWKYGRDEAGRGTIIPEYDAPADISPALASEIMYERVTVASLSATIIELAVHGYLTIHREEETTLGIFKSVTYRFDAVKPADATLTDDEAAVYTALFKGRNSVTSTDLKTGSELVRAKSTIGSDAAAKMVSLGYYRMNPTTVKTVYIALGVGVAILGYFFASAIDSAWVFVSLLLTGVFIALFGLIMPAKTRKGSLAKEQILGLKDYLQIAEKNRLDFHNAPEKSPELFEKLLPYAIMLGVSAVWAKEFEGLYKTPPGWYNGGSYAAFTPVVFADDMNAMSSTISTLATPTSSGGGSGGGGFSGGGFGGGGGGGSW